MKIGLVQMRVTAHKEDNLRRAEEGVLRAAEQGAEIVALPEMFCCPFLNELFPSFAEPKTGEVYRRLRDLAKKAGVILVAGSFPEIEGEKLYNSCFVFDRDGNEIANHRKAHLYDVDIKDGPSMMESDVFSKGDALTFFEVDGHKFGLTICFDIRFPEMFMALGLAGAEAVFVPAAFNTKTGPMHWELLYRTRAVDNQLFTIGISPSRHEDDPYVSHGHSIIASPWAEVILDAGEEEGVHVVDVDLEESARVREEMPLLKLRRPEVYGKL